eukprot:sb/3473525/
MSFCSHSNCSQTGISSASERLLPKKEVFCQEKVAHLQGADRAAAVASLLGKVTKPLNPPTKPPQPEPINIGIPVPKLDTAAQATSALLKGGPVTAVSGKGLAAQIAATINAKKNFGRAKEEDLLQNPVTAPPAKVEDEVEINDLPQQAR